MDIEQLLEKFLTGYKSPQRPGTDVEVFVNPTQAEVREVQRASEFKAIRFIVDSRNKKVYMWASELMLHLQMWNNLKKELGDSRKIYSCPSLLSGELEKNGYDWYSMSLNDPEDKIQFYLDDWKWVDKYLPNFNRDMRLELVLYLTPENKETIRQMGVHI